MICKVRKAIERYSMPLYGKTVAVGVSGGADSMALLNVLSELKNEYKINVVACHVNHGIRGEAADSDEHFVRSECEKMGVELRVLRADVPALAEKEHIGLEECGRRVRYDFFNSIGQDILIATAHTLSDRCETLIMNITRGSSMRGICSIPPVRDNIVRPLICCTRSDIELYCNENKISYITDETNFDDTYSRNRIRLNVIPELKKLNPSFEEACQRLIFSAEDENTFMNMNTESSVKKARLEQGYDAVFIGSLPSSLRYRMLFSIFVNETGIVPETIHLDQIDSVLNGGKTEVLGDNIVEVKKGVLRFNPPNEKHDDWVFGFDKLYAETPYGKISGRIINKNNLPPKQFVHNRVVDYDKISDNLVIRNRRPGDKIKLAGSACTKTLKKLFNEKHLENRGNLPILADKFGVIWVMGLGCADRCKITDSTQNILLIREDEEND